MYEGNGLKLMREFYAKYNMISFPGGNTGAQMGGWFRKEVKSLADLKKMVGLCNTELRLDLFPEDEADVTAFLNKQFYKFKP